METLAHWDRAAMALVHALRAPWLDTAFSLVTWLGSLMVLLPLALLLWWRWRGRRGAAFVALGLFGASVLGHLLKLVVERPRPELYPPLIAMPADWSFPSAHAVQVTAFALAWLHRPGGAPGRIETAVLFAAVLAVSVSRLYLQVHFPSDIVAGIVLATLWITFLRRMPAWRENPS